MTLAQRNLQSTRLIHLSFLFAAVAYTAIPFLIALPKAAPPSAVIIGAFAVISISTLAAGFFIRARLVQPASELLRANPEDGAAGGRWRIGVMLALVFAESVLLFGFALRILGASWAVCGGFYGVGIFFLVAWTPKLELAPR
ncbi:MAG TPA: hypothetical protein VLX60_06565 [Terriglobales bacterium]|nr:hypothetical protein [Terriglobales bacterium]